jgi:hypothetical protein
MRRNALQLVFTALAVALLAGLWLASGNRQETAGATAETTVNAARMDRTVETSAIRQALHRYVEEHGQAATPEADVDLAQVSIDADYALVIWTHEGDGGHAVLQQQAGVWNVKESGPGWLGFRGVCKEGVPDVVAKRLLDAIDPNWPSYETF